ncbi:hypothetical protein M406DRAFT_249735, partial [Cryphonectria parasitica EP155]
LMNLKQTKSASAYTVRFKQLSAQLPWKDKNLMKHYYKELKDNIKDEISKQD